MNNRIRALNAHKESRLFEANKLSATAASAGRTLSVSEQERWDALMAEVDGINAQIKAEMDMVHAERTAPALPRNPASTAGATKYLDDDVSQRNGGRKFVDLFPRSPRSDNGFGRVGEFLACVNSGMPDPRLILAAATGSSEGVGADGGALVPERFLAEMLDESLESEVVRPRASVYGMETSSLWIAGFDMGDNRTAIGGFSLAWADEGQQLTFQKAKTRAMKLVAAKAGILTAATNELVADSTYFTEELPRLMTDAAGFGLDEAFLLGDGTGKPRGVLSDPALITVDPEAGQGPGLVYENLVKMYARLHPRLHSGAVWVVSHELKVPLLQLVQHVFDVAGTEHVGGVPVRVLQEDSGKFYLLGLEVLFSEKLPPAGEKGDILLANFSQYAVGLRRQATIDRSGHLLFDRDETAFRLVLRVDGQGRWNGPMQPRNGESMSWCVTLGERS